jgi:hypothetical protein
VIAENLPKIIQKSNQRCKKLQETKQNKSQTDMPVYDEL